MAENELFEASMTGNIGVFPSLADAATRVSLEHQEKYNAATLTNFEQNRNARKKYSHRIFWITICWLASTILILVGVGLNWLLLSNSVLLALLGTASVNVLGFFAIVIQYLFNKEKST